MAILIKTNGDHQAITPLNGTDFKLEELQRYVGGLIEILKVGDDGILVINEEGKLLGLDANELASLVWFLNEGWDAVVGDVVWCKSEEVQ